MLRGLVSVVLVTMFVAAGYAQQAANQAPAAGPGKLLEKQPYVMSPAQVQQYPEQDFFFLTSDATQKTMPEVMRKLMPRLSEAAKTAGLAPPSGPVVIVMNGISPDPDGKFEVEVGFIYTQSEIKPAGDAQVRKLEPFKCASLLYTGGFESAAKAYESIFGTIMASGQVPTMAIRQMMLYFEDEKSVNNVSLIMVGIQ